MESKTAEYNFILEKEGFTFIQFLPFRICFIYLIM